MKLHERLFLVGSGSLGFGLTDPFDCHVYALRMPTSVILIDSGSGRDPNRIIDEMTADGLRPDAVSHVLLTHGHADHAGGAAYWRDAVGATVVASEEISSALTSGDESAISLDRARNCGMYPGDYKFQPCVVDEYAESFSSFQFGEELIECIPTPGHSLGCVSYLWVTDERRHLFTGDSLFWGGRLALQSIYDCDLQQSLDSVRSLAQLEFDALLPGHLGIDLSSGKSHATAAMSVVDRMGVPANIQG
jgi:hydroxyacylglutathione hydrolase